MEDAKCFYEALILRLEKFNLEVEKEKTKIIKLNNGNDDNNSNIYGKSLIQGHCNYYGITDNIKSVENFRDKCKELIYKWLNRRSQKRSFSRDKFIMFLKKYPLPRAKVKLNIFKLGAGSIYLL